MFYISFVILLIILELFEWFILTHIFFFSSTIFILGKQSNLHWDYLFHFLIIFIWDIEEEYSLISTCHWKFIIDERKICVRWNCWKRFFKIKKLLLICKRIWNDILIVNVCWRVIEMKCDRPSHDKYFWFCWSMDWSLLFDRQKKRNENSFF